MQIQTFFRLNSVVNLAAAVATCWFVSRETAVAADESAPETVLITLHVKPGREAELEKVLAESWMTYERLHLVREQPPHLVMSGSDGRKMPFIAEVLTWTSSSVPDHAPAEVLALWSQMHSLCEARDDRQDIEFSEVQLVGDRDQKR